MTEIQIRLMQWGTAHTIEATTQQRCVLRLQITTSRLEVHKIITEALEDACRRCNTQNFHKLPTYFQQKSLDLPGKFVQVRGMHEA